MLGTCALACGEEPTHPVRAPGHSVHGEAFNEGPRQKPKLIGGTGKVTLEITAKSPEAKAFFDQGLGQLHGFWYFEAERSFRQAVMLDPDCAMAYWGLALANVNQEDRARKFADEASKRKDKVSPREQRYIAAVNEFFAEKKPKKERFEKYIKALEKLLYDYPNELEAKSFLALALWQGREDGLPITSYLAVNALLSEIFTVEPMHPSHHYRIHLWDHERAENAIPSAARSGQAAPKIAHMWHMGGHIFSDLERYADAVWQQEASSRVDHAYMIEDWILPDQIHNYAHNQEWMIRNLGHIGRVNDAVMLAKNLIENPRHPKYNTEKKGSASHGKRRLFETLEHFELWRELTEAARSGHLETPDTRQEQAELARWLGLAAFRQNEFASGEQELAKLVAERATVQQELQRLRSPQDDNPDHPATAAFPVNGKQDQQRKDLERDAKRLDKFAAEMRGVRAFQRHDFAGAFKELKEGEADRVDQFFLARVQWLAGEKEEALKKVRQAMNSRKNQVRALALGGDLLWLAGLKEDAKLEFEKLRALSGELDLASPVFARLAPVAQELGWPADWRIKSPPAPDTGDRPPLDSLGPFIWSPPAMRSWNAVDAQGKLRAAAEFLGKPVIVIFYLGHGCLHCTQQLTAFAERQAEFEKLGVQLIGIGTDTLPDLTASLKNYEPKSFPFPLLSDAGFTAFKEWRCFDDFENQPLHGTFLVDAQGRLRWWDIGHEPFLDAEFVLKETARLLKLPVRGGKE
ncbi:MAG: redoxin domain-containing protein [Planctomycetaceae bacterium]